MKEKEKTKITEKEVQAYLFSMRDEEYKRFSGSLMPTVDADSIIGVRVPTLRKYARALAKNADVSSFLQTLPHRYYEENNIHAFLIEQNGNFEETVAALNAFLPFVDNWATCDSLAPRILAEYPEKTLSQVLTWLAAEHPYTVRYAIGTLMRYYLDERFHPRYLALVAAIRSDEYYVNMMVAWYFATALAKQWDSALPYISSYRLSNWIHNKTIQKAIESYRIAEAQKNILREYRIKIKNKDKTKGDCQNV